MYSIEVRNKAVELKKAGYSYKEIAQMTGLSVHWCSKYLRNVKKGSVSYE